jgi:uncharacterized protein YbaP (TraB family)
MRITLFRRLCWLLLLAPALAQAEPLHPAQLHPALWKVTRHHTTIWLFGTIHMLPADAHWLDGTVAQAADSADEIATEIDDPDGSKTRAALAAHTTLPAGTRLSGLMPADERAAFAERLGRFGIKPEQVDDKKPWFAAVMLSALPLMRRGIDPHNGVEAGLYAREAGRKVQRIGIETPDEQLGVLDGLPQASQLGYLKEVIDDFDSSESEITAMITAWGKGDAEGLARLMNEDEGKDDPLLIDRLITQRNHRFADWVAARLARPGTVFMAVGAGHLAGPGSVQDDLARLGITVKRVQ